MHGRGRPSVRFSRQVVEMPVPPDADRFATSSTHIDVRHVAHYDVRVRTTLTIDDDVAAALKALARNSGKTFKAVVNEVMRRGLMTGEKPVPDREPFRVESVRCGFLPGIDPLKLNQLVDELEVDEFLERTQGRGTEPS